MLLNHLKNTSRNIIKWTSRNLLGHLVFLLHESLHQVQLKHLHTVPVDEHDAAEVTHRCTRTAIIRAWKQHVVSIAEQCEGVGPEI